MRYSYRCCTTRYGRRYQLQDDVIPYKDEFPEPETDTDDDISLISRINVTSEKGYTVIRCVDSSNKELCKKRIKEKPVRVYQLNEQGVESNDEQT